MSHKQRLRRAAAHVLSYLPHRGLDYVDALAQEAQGKGWGYAGASAEVQAVRRCLSFEGHGPPRLILDIGANIGDWTVASRQLWPSAMIYCFEPSPQAAAELQKRTSRDGRIKVVRAALGSETGRAQFYADSPGSPLGSLRDRRLDHFGISLNLEDSVPLLTVDDFLRSRGIHAQIDVVKIDVEGSEMEVLQGAQDALSRTIAIQFEWGEASTGSPVHWVDFWYFWRDRGMKLYRIAPRGPRLVTRYHPRDEVMTWTNYVAVRPRKVDQR